MFIHFSHRTPSPLSSTVLSLLFHPSLLSLISFRSSPPFFFSQFNLSLNRPHLFQPCMSVKLSTDTHSLQRIKHTSLVAISKRRTTLLTSVVPRSPALSVALSLLSSAFLALHFHPSASVSFKLCSIKDNPTVDASCTLCSSSKGESQVSQERDCTSSTNEAWGDPNAL